MLLLLMVVLYWTASSHLLEQIKFFSGCVSRKWLSSQIISMRLQGKVNTYTKEKRKNSKKGVVSKACKN